MGQRKVVDLVQRLGSKWAVSLAACGESIRVTQMAAQRVVRGVVHLELQMVLYSGQRLVPLKADWKVAQKDGTSDAAMELRLVSL